MAGGSAVVFTARLVAAPAGAATPQVTSRPAATMIADARLMRRRPARSNRAHRPVIKETVITPRRAKLASAMRPPLRGPKNRKAAVTADTPGSSISTAAEPGNG